VWCQCDIRINNRSDEIVLDVSFICICILILISPFTGRQKYIFSDPVWPKEFFRTCNVLPFSCTHLALGKVKDPRYMQNKKDSRISLVWPLQHGAENGEV
jgi:hypothetical protein